MTFIMLAKVWAARDSRYATLRKALSPEQEEVIRAFRRTEADNLAGVARLRALSVVNSWRPPVRTR